MCVTENYPGGFTIPLGLNKNKFEIKKFFENCKIEN
jgi:hypothetical protein